MFQQVQSPFVGLEVSWPAASPTSPSSSAKHKLRSKRLIHGCVVLACDFGAVWQVLTVFQLTLTIHPDNVLVFEALQVRDCVVRDYRVRGEGGCGDDAFV